MNTACKRIMDLTLALIGLSIAAPVMGLIALSVWLDSPGPVIFAQERIGLHGKIFRLYKFRKFPIHCRDAGPKVTVAGDARMTRIGAFLERTKLDELPQLWNILKGDMSFVGPRPELRHFADLFTDRYAALLDYLPGLFGPNQVAYRNESELYPADEDPEIFYRRELFRKKADNDLAYFSRASCSSDLMWICRGIWSSLAGAIRWRRLIADSATLIALDALLIECAWTLANLVRFSGLPSGEDLFAFVSGLWLFPPLLIVIQYLGGCYSHPKRYFCLVDAIRLTRVVSMAWLLAFTFLIGFASRSVSLFLIPIGWVLLMSLLPLPRIGFRIRDERAHSNQSQHSSRVVIYGAGDGGMALARWMSGKTTHLKLLGFLDDNPHLRGKVVGGYPILGRESDIATIHAVHNIDEIWVTFQPPPPKRYRLDAWCEKTGANLILLMELEPFSQIVNRQVGQPPALQGSHER